MTILPDPDSLFRVSMSAKVAQRVRTLSDAAAIDGRAQLFIDALRIIDVRLQNDPVDFGEELFNLQQHRAVVKLAVRLPIAVEFGLYPEHRLVLIRNFHHMAPAT